MEDVGVDVSQDEDETGEQRYESRGEVNSVTRYNSSQGLRIFFFPFFSRLEKCEFREKETGGVKVEYGECRPNTNNCLV